MRRLLVIATVLVLWLSCVALAANQVGNRGSNTLSGTAGQDVLKGKGGDDTLIGNNGRDRLIGGPGDDTLLGGGGRDRLNGGPGVDVITCGNGRDVVYTDGADRISPDCETVRG